MSWISISVTGRRTARIQNPAWGALCRTDGRVLLSKSLRPLPEKFHGLTDVETAIATICRSHRDPDVRPYVRLRFKIVSAIRRFMEGRGFIEVETPMCIRFLAVPQPARS